MKAKNQKARLKGDYQLDTVTLWNRKGILTLAYARQAITQGMAVSHKWVTYVQRCLFTLTNAHNPNQIQVSPAIFKYNFSQKPLLFGPSSFHSLDPSICYMDFYLLRLHAP